MSDDSINIPKETINRLKACLSELEAIIKTAETSTKEGADRPLPPSKKTIMENKLDKYIDNIKI